MIDKSDYIFNNRVGRILEVVRCLIISVDHTCDGAVEERFGSRCVLHEVEHQHVVEVTINLVHVFEVDAVVQLGELQNDFDDLGFVVSAEAAVGSPTEDSLAALEDQVRANRVLSLVESLVKWLLLW